MNIIKKPSPNYSTGRLGYRPEAIVIHVMDGTLVGTDSWFANPQSAVSAHWKKWRNTSLCGGRKYGLACRQNKCTLVETY